MSERRTPRDVRRRTFGQNFLVDQRVIDRLITSLDLQPGELVVDIGAGTGALTVPLVEVGRALGLEVWAVEPDPRWADRLTERTRGSRTRVIRSDLARLRLPRTPYRVVANPPFGFTTELLGLLLDDPDRGPGRADLVLQREVADKFATAPATTLRGAGWAPWWQFTIGDAIGRGAFRPVPGVDASVLTIQRRDPPPLPPQLAAAFGPALRTAWIDTYEPTRSTTNRHPTRPRLRPQRGTR